MKKTLALIFLFLSVTLGLHAQDARQRTVETVVADVLAAMPAQNSADFRTQMTDLAAAARVDRPNRNPAETRWKECGTTCTNTRSAGGELRQRSVPKTGQTLFWKESVAPFLPAPTRRTKLF